MSEVIIFDRMQQRRGTAANLASVNEVLRVGEFCVELVTGKFKIGDGSTAWNSLPYAVQGPSGFRYTSDTGSTADSDPGAGLFKWNHATQSSATFLYFDDATSDTATDLSTFFTSLSSAPTGFVHVVNERDGAQWQVWKWSAITDGTGYWKFAVTLQASAASLADNVPVRVTFVPLGGYTDEQVRDVMAATLVAGTNMTITVNDPGDTITLAAAGSGGGGVDAATTVYESWDFVKQGATTSAATGTSFVTTGAAPVAYISTGGTAPISTEAGAPGYVALTAALAAGDYVRMFLTPGLVLVVGGGEMRLKFRVRLPVLSDATNTYQLSIGLRNVITGAVTNAINANYTHSVNSGKWRLDTISGGTTVPVDTATVGPVANTWTTVELLINAAGTQVDLIVDGAAMAVSTVNIPTAALGVFCGISKSAGALARIVHLDYVELSQTLTTTR